MAPAQGWHAQIEKWSKFFRLLLEIAVFEECVSCQAWSQAIRESNVRRVGSWDRPVLEPQGACSEKCSMWGGSVINLRKWWPEIALQGFSNPRLSNRIPPSSCSMTSIWMQVYFDSSQCTCQQGRAESVRTNPMDAGIRKTCTAIARKKEQKKTSKHCMSWRQWSVGHYTA
jgi:hypothetical protein